MKIAWLLVVPVILFTAQWAAGDVFGTFDTGRITIPLEDVFARYQRAGEIPVWAPEFQGGFPLMANAIQSFFYPPHLLLRQFLPGVWVVNVSLLLHTVLAAFGMRALLRGAGLSDWAATIGGLIFSSGGYFVGRITLAHLLFPAAWIPWILWALMRAWHETTARRVLLFSALAALQIFAGHIQMVVYTALLSAVVGIALLAQTHWRAWRRRWPLALAPIIIYLLAAVHLMPARELIQQSKRAGALTGAEAFNVSYNPGHLITWLKPDALGHQEAYTGAKNEPELMAYVGLLGLILAAAGLLSKRARRSPLGIAGGLLVICGLVLALGEHSPIFLWLREHSAFASRLANPGRAIVITFTGIAILAGFGVPRLKKTGQVAAGAVALELLFAAWLVNPTLPAEVWREPLAAGYLPEASAGSPRVFTHFSLSPIGEGDFAPEVGPRVSREVVLRQTFAPQRDLLDAVEVELTWDASAPKAGEVTLAIMRNGEELRRVSLPGTDIKNEAPVRFLFEPIADAKNSELALVFTSSYTRSDAPRMVVRTNRDGDDFNPTGSLTLCREGNCTALGDASFRLEYKNTDERWLTRELLTPLFGEAEGFRMVRGHLALQLERVSLYMYEMGERGNFDASRLLTARDMFDRLAIGAIITSFSDHRDLKGLDNLKKIAEIPAGERNIHIYRNEQAYPRVQLVEEVLPVAGPTPARDAVSGGLPRNTVTAEMGKTGLRGSFNAGEFEILEDEPRSMALGVQGETEQFLVIRDAYYPGWKALVDGQEVAIFPVDSIWRGVLIPAGGHRVQFRFESSVWRRSALVSGISWAALGLAGIAGITWKRHEKTT